MDLGTTVFVIAIIAFSAIVHEVAHGYVADMFGDPTARYAGRLTLNPLPHIDLFGSILLPLFFLISGVPFFFGYAKPVPVNTYNLRPGRFPAPLVAAAGPLSNLAIALIGAVVIRLGLSGPAQDVVGTIVLVNLMLGIFNLVPVPPLDGSKVVDAFLPRKLMYSYDRYYRAPLEANPLLGMLIAVTIIYLLGSVWSNLIVTAVSALTGLH